MIDGTSVYTKEQEDKDETDLIKKTKTLLLVDDGVIVADIPVISTKLSDVVLNTSVL